jgi:hypothetical protein
MGPKNKKTSGEEQCDREQEEGEEQDHPEDQHHPAHLRIGPEHEGDRAEEDDSAPPMRSRGLGRRALGNREGFLSRPRCPEQAEEEGQEEPEKNEEDTEEREGARTNHDRDDEDEVQTRLSAKDRQGESDESRHEGPWAGESNGARGETNLGAR